MVDKGQRHPDFSDMPLDFLSLGKLWTFGIQCMLLFKTVNPLGEGFVNVEMGFLILAEIAKMKGSPPLGVA